MATALQLPAPDTGPAFNEVSSSFVSPHTHMNDFPNRISIADFDLKDTRYPTIGSSRASWVNYPGNGSPKSWLSEKLVEEPVEEQQQQQQQLLRPQSQQAQYPTAEGTLSAFATPSGSPPRFSDRFGRDEPLQRRPSKGGSRERSRVRPEISQGPDMGQRQSSLRPSQDQFGSLLIPPSPRHPSLPASGIMAGPSASPKSPVVPLSASPSYSPSAMQVHISPKPRASAQYPTYINPPPGASTMNAAYAPAQVPREEVCVECAMRDQDMADVDATSPGVWARESDADYEDLVRREQEEEATGIYHPESSSRPRATGQPLSEENLKFWTSINPKEPSSRQQTLDQYVKSQRSLIEAEALAHARAMQEARQLEDKMRNTYSQLRRSAYELSNNPQLAEDASGVRIKPPRVASMPSGAILAVNTNNHGREVTLLENGMIVEHVDVRKEEKEERERRRREERRSRGRKSSRSSAVDVASIYSMPIPGQKVPTDSGFFSGPRGSDSRYSQSFSPRPSSVLTMGADRPHMLPRAYSQASFSDMQSIGSSSSPRRSRFFGFKNLTSGWRSQDSLAPSGSMMDMHVALQREQQYLQDHPAADMRSNTPTLQVSEVWAKEEATSRTATPVAEAPKKKNGLKKIWKIVTGSSSKSGSRQKGRDSVRSMEKVEDDTPLDPPPPLSYLVDRERGLASRRHVSTPSLPSSVSPNPMSSYAPSPPTAPSSLVPSPTSSRQPVNEKDNMSDGRNNSGNHDTDQEHHGPSGDTNSPEWESRGRTTQSSSKTLSSYGGPQTPATGQSVRPHSVAIRRDKSLPPLPGESSVEFPDHPMPDARPQTMFTYNHLPMSFSGDLSPNKLLPPNAPFRTADKRRQSFGGLGSAARSLPGKGMLGLLTPTAPSPAFHADERYGEFGSSRLSLSQWESARGSQRSRDENGKPRQRRSRFGLASLFSKRSYGGDSKESGYPEKEYAASGFRSSGSEREEAPSNGNPYSPGSAHSSSAQRMSMASRKNIAELVDQDPEFVAYRYPSTDARLDLG